MYVLLASNNYTFTGMCLSPCHVYLLLYTLYGYFQILAILIVTGDMSAGALVVVFLSPKFHELWRSMMSICLFTEVKLQWATLVLGWVTV